MANAPLNTDLNEFPVGGRSSKDIAAQQKAMIPELAKAETEAELLPKQVLAGEKAKGAERIFEGLSKRIDEKRAKEAEFPYPEFHPTQDNAVSIGEMFSLIATMGVALGGSGKLSSLNSLNAMGGMLQGWQQGRKDLFDKEKSIFDKEFARIKQIRDDLNKDLKEYFELAPYDKEAANLKAEEIAAKNPGVVAAYVKNREMQKLYELNNSLLKASLEVEKKAGLGGKLSPKMEAELQGNIAVAENLSALSRMVDYIGKNEPMVFGPAVGRVPGDISQLYQSDRAKQTKALMADLMTKKLKDRSGATVTVQEWSRAQPFIPTEKDTVETIQSKIRSMYDLIAEETELYAERSKAGGAVKERFTGMDQPLQPSFRKQVTTGGEPVTTTETKQTYKTAEDVRAAYNSGQITKEEAIAILKRDFKKT
jgi:hypothetical protein